MNSKNATPKYSLFRNWLSLIGLVVTLGSLFSFALLLTFDALSPEASPYLGILTFVVSPMFLVFGMLLIGLGWLMHRRQVHKSLPGSPPPFLQIDFTRARDRRNLAVFFAGGLVFLLFAAMGSYHTYHFAESEMFCGQICHPPMKPEYTAYTNSPHARVACTACHVGPGPTSFVKAKLNGVNQLQATLRNTYHRPIKTPIEGMRLAQETCEKCHWPKKFVGNLDRTYTRFLSDDDNTPVTTRLSLKVGGGDPTHGPVGGIHWHMNLANKVEYIATDEKRQVIPWVRLTNTKGEVTEFRTKDFKDDPAQHTIRRMDCMACHNRPAHHFRAPGDAVDLAMSTGKIDPKLKAIKKTAVEVLSQEYATEAEALGKIAARLKTNYVHAASLDATVAAVQQIYRQNIFPEMKASWKAYPDNIGHKNWAGCFRCHDGQHKTADGQRSIGASDCNACHTVISQVKGSLTDPLEGKRAKFEHPDAASDGTERDCTTCHSVSQ